MIRSGPDVRAILLINLMLLYASCLGALAWLCWPETAESWRMGLFSSLCGVGCLAIAIRGNRRHLAAHPA